MLPNYILFGQAVSRKQPPLRPILNEAWRLLSEGVSSADCEHLAQTCDAAAPDTEDHQHLLTSSALDACVSIANLMRFFSSNEVDLVIESAGLARDSIDLYVQETENMSVFDASREQRIVSHPLMQTELALQTEDLALLKALQIRCQMDLTSGMRDGLVQKLVAWAFG